MVLERRNYELYRAIERSVLTPQAIFNAFNKDSRSVVTKVEIFFDGLNKPPYTMIPEDDELIDWQILEEISQDSVHPVGNVLANVLDLSILNTDDKFNPYNEAGPWYGKIKEFLPIRVWLSEEDLLPEYVHMGTFYVANWKMQKSTNTVAVTAYNAFQQIIAADAPLIPMRQNVSVGDFLQEFFLELDVSINHIDIEARLFTVIMNNAYGLDGIVSNTLNEIAKAYLLYIWMDRDDIIHVQSISVLKSDNDFTITDDDQVVSVDMGYSITKQYSKVNVTYSIGRNVEYIELANISDHPVYYGTNMLEKIKPSKSPVRSIEAVIVRGPKSVSITQYRCTPWQLWAYFISEYQEEFSAEISIQGTALLDGTFASYTAANPAFNGKTLDVENVFLEGAAQAKELADTLLTYLMNDNAVCDVEVRGNPALQLGNSLTVDDNIDKIFVEGVTTQLKFTYDSGLSGSLKALNKEAVV